MVTRNQWMLEIYFEQVFICIVNKKAEIQSRKKNGGPTKTHENSPPTNFKT